jgi:RNA polymerase sigma factor (TIGR02999 family)
MKKNFGELTAGKQCYNPRNHTYRFLNAGRPMAGPATQPGTQPRTHDVTKLLQAWGQGENSALERMIPLVYKELRRIAHRYMAGERKGHTLQTTALVNEAYLKLTDCGKDNWQNRAHFFAISAQLMRRILVDFARSRGYQKRGGGAHKVTLDENLVGPIARDRDLVALDDAMKALAEVDPRKSKVVELRFFGGLSVEEAADVLHVTPRTVLRDWRLAKFWLHREMARGGRYDA